MNDLIEKLRRIAFRDGEADLQAMYDLVAQIKKLENGRALVPSILLFFEEHADKDVGSPGPFVHFIEEEPDYHELLKDSIARKPTCITLWMVNRLLNGIPDERDRDDWINVLRAVLAHPAADEHARKSAENFLHHQERRTP